METRWINMNIVDENNKKMQWKKEIEKDTTFLSRTTPDGYSLALHTRYNKGWLHTTWLWFQCLVSKGWWNTAVAHECFFSAWVLIISADTVLKNFLIEKKIYIYIWNRWNIHKTFFPTRRLQHGRTRRSTPTHNTNLEKQRLALAKTTRLWLMAEKCERRENIHNKRKITKSNTQPSQINFKKGRYKVQ